MRLDIAIPIYLQVEASIKKDIAAGRIQPGEKLPSARELALKHKINPNTASRVYQNLEQQGLCCMRRGMGTYVTDEACIKSKVKQEMARELIRHFKVNMMELGCTKEEIHRMIDEEDK